MKKVICIIAFIALLQGFSYIVEGITQCGWGGVNYGRIIFPLLISGISFWQYKRFRKMRFTSSEEV